MTTIKGNEIMDKTDVMLNGNAEWHGCLDGATREERAQKMMPLRRMMGTNFALGSEFRGSKRFARYTERVKNAIQVIMDILNPSNLEQEHPCTLEEQVYVIFDVISATNDKKNNPWIDPNAPTGEIFLEKLIGEMVYLKSNSATDTLSTMADGEKDIPSLQEMSEKAIRETAVQFLYEKAFGNPRITESTAIRLASPETARDCMECFLLYMRALLGTFAPAIASTAVLYGQLEKFERNEENANIVNEFLKNNKGISTENEHLKAEVERLRRSIASEREQTESIRRGATTEAEHTLMEQMREKDEEIARLKRRLAAELERRKEELVPDEDSQIEDERLESTIDAGINIGEMAAKVGKLLFVIGLEGEARNRIEAAFPGSRAERPERVTDELVKGANLIVFNTEFVDHHQYWRVKNLADSAGVPFLHTKSHNINHLAKLVWESVREEKTKKQA